MKISVKTKEVKGFLSKYNPYLSRRDVGKIFQESIKNPSKNLNKVTEEYLLKKYSIDKISQLVEKSKEKSLPLKKVMQKLKISKTRLYFNLNLFKKYSKKKGLVLERGKITKKKSKDVKK